MAKNIKSKIDREAPASVGFVQDLVNEAVDTILKGIQHLQDGNMREFEKLRKGQKENSINIEVLKKGQEDIKEKLNDMTLSHPSREEFDALKKKVFRHHPSN